MITTNNTSDFFGPGGLDSAAGTRMFEPAIAGKAVQVLGNPDLLHTYSYLPDIGRGLALLGERSETLGQAWHLPNAPAVTTRQFIGLIRAVAGTRPQIQAAPRLLIQGLGLVNLLMRELAEMLYEFEEPFIVDDSRFRQTFGLPATPLEEAIKTTFEWFRRK